METQSRAIVYVFAKDNEVIGNIHDKETSEIPINQ